MRFDEDLHRLRAGDIPFDAFSRIHRTSFVRLAHRFMRQWRPVHLEAEDLAQHAMLTAWRSVDIWEDDRGVPLEAFVNYQMGRALRVECERDLGWPSKGRKDRADREPVRPVYDHEILTLVADKSTDCERLAIGRAAAELFEGLQRDAVAGVVNGAPIKTIAQRAYADPVRREAYGLTTLEKTIRLVRTHVRTAPKIICAAA